MGSGGWSLSSGMSLAAAFQAASLVYRNPGFAREVASATPLNPALWASSLSGRSGSRLETLTAADESCVRPFEKRQSRRCLVNFRFAVSKVNPEPVSWLSTESFDPLDLPQALICLEIRRK